MTEPTAQNTAPEAVSSSAPKADWIVAAIRGELPKTIDEMKQLGISADSFSIEESPETYWGKQGVRKLFTDGEGKERRDVFDNFFVQHKQLKNEFSAVERDLNNSEFLKLGAQSYLDKFTGVEDTFSMYSKRGGVVDPWGRNENFGVFSPKRWGLLEKAADNGVKLPSGQYVSPDEFDGHVKAARDENGAFLFDEKGLPYFVPVEDGEELKQHDVVYNSLAKKMGFYGHDYSMWQFLGSFVKAPINFTSQTLDSFAEIPKVLVQAVDEDNAFVRGTNNFQQDAKSWYIPTTEEGQESLWTFENSLDSLQQVAYQLLAMYATGGASAALTGSARIGSLTSRATMLGMTLGPVSQMSKENGLSSREAAFMMLASAPFLYAAQGLSEQLVRGLDPTKYRAGLQQILQNEYKVIQAQGLNPATARSVLYNTRTKIGELLIAASKIPGVGQGAILEGMEESAEQIVDLASRIGYNLTQGSVVEKEGKKGFQIDWMSELNALGFAGTMGAAGGAIGKGLINRFNKDIPDFQRSIIDVFAQGNGQKLYQFLDDIEQGRTNFTFDAPWQNQKGEDLKPGEKSKNQIIIEAIRSMAKYAEEIVDKSGMKDAIRNNEASAGQLRDALKNSNIGSDYANLTDAKLKLQEKMDTFDKATGSKEDMASWQEQMNLIDKDLESIKSATNLTKYLEEGMYNAFRINGKASPYITGKDFHNLNSKREDVVTALNAQISGYNEKLRLRDESVSLLDFNDDSKGAYTEAGKIRLLAEFEQASLPKIQSVVDALPQINEIVIPQTFIGYDPADFVDYQSALKKIKQMNDDDVELIEEVLPDVGKVIREIATVDFQLNKDLREKKVAETKPSISNKSSYLSMTERIKIGNDSILIPNPTFIEDKILEEEETAEPKNDISLYTAGDRVKKIIDSIEARKAQISSLNEVASAINPTKLKKDGFQIPLLSQVDKDELITVLDDLKRRALLLQEKSDQNEANSELRIAQAMGKFLEKTLSSLEKIGDVLSKTEHSSIANLIGQNHLPLAQALRAHDNDAFLQTLVSLEHQIYVASEGKSQQILAAFAKDIDKGTYQSRMSQEGMAMAKAYDLLRGILSVSTADVMSDLKDTIGASGNKALNPTIQQALIAIRAVQNMIAGSYDYPAKSVKPHVFHFTSMIDADPGAGKTTVEAALIAGIMQRLTSGKVFMTAHPDTSSNERKNNLENAVYGFFREEGSAVSKIDTTNFSGSLLDFLKADSTVNGSTTLIIFDEGTLVTDNDLEEVAKQLNVVNQTRIRHKQSPMHLLFLGDTFQKTATVDAGDGNQASGVSNAFKFVFPRTERIDFSFRVQNQSLKALNDFFKDIQVVGKKPAPYFEFKGEKGVRIFNDKPQFHAHVAQMLNTAKQDGAVSDYLYITDVPQTVPTAIRDTGVDVMTPEQAQGKERRHVIVDLSDTQVFTDENPKKPLKQAYYTAFTRAKEGVTTFFPADQGLFSKEGNVTDIKPLVPKESSKQDFLKRLENILAGHTKGVGVGYRRKEHNVITSDPLVPEGPKVSETPPVVSQTPNLVSQILREVNERSSVTGWSYVTIVPEGSSLEEQVELKKKYLYDKEFADGASFQLTVAKIGSKRMSAILNKYGAKKDMTGAYGIFLEGVRDGKTTVVAALDSSNATAIVNAVKPAVDEEIIIPLTENPLRYASRKHPYILKQMFNDDGSVNKSGEPLTLKEIKESAPPGIVFSKVLVATSDEKENGLGLKFVKGRKYVAISFKHTENELNEFIRTGRGGKFDDADIQYHELDRPSFLKFDATLASMSKYMTDVKNSHFNEEGYRIEDAVWGYFADPKYSKRREEMFNEIKNKTRDKDYLAFIDNYAKKRFKYLIRNLVGFRKKAEMKQLDTRDSRIHQLLERFFQDLKETKHFEKGMYFNPRLRLGSTKGNPYVGFAVEFENKEIYDDLLQDISGGVTYPAIQINKEKLAAMVKTVEANIAPPTPPVIEKDEATITNTEAPTADKTEVPTPVRASNSLTQQQFFKAHFENFDTTWFSESKRRFKKAVYDSIYVLKGDNPRINSMDAAVRAARGVFDASRKVVKLEDLGTDPDKDMYIDNIIALHFDWYMSQFFPAVKQKQDGTYVINAKSYKPRENFERDNFSLLDEGISAMVWTQLENTPILSSLSGQLKETGSYLGKEHIEDLINELRGVYTQNDFEARLKNHPSEAVQSFYYRFLHETPYTVNGEIHHSFSALKNIEDGVHVKTAVLAAIRSGEIYRMAYVDLAANKNKIPGANTPNNIKQLAIESVAQVFADKRVSSTNGVITISTTSGKRNFSRQDDYTDAQVIEAMKSIGIPFFTQGILDQIISTDSLNSSTRGTISRGQVKKIIMQDVFFPIATMSATSDFSKILTPRLNGILRVIQQKYGVTSLSDLNLDGEKENRLRRTATVFSLEYMKQLVAMDPNHILRDNLVINDFFRVSSAETALKKGIRLNARKAKSNSDLSEQEMLEYDMLWNFKELLDKDPNRVMFTFVPYADSGSDLSHIVSMGQSGKSFYRNPEEIATSLFGSRMHYYNKLEEDILNRWLKVGIPAKSLRELKQILLTIPVAAEDLTVKKLQLYKNLDYVIMDGKLTIKEELIRNVEKYRDEKNLPVFLQEMEARAQKLIEESKTMYDVRAQSLYDRIKSDKHTAEVNIRAFHYNWVAFSTEMDHIFNGPIHQYKGLTEQDEYVDNNKRARSSTSNGAVMVFRDENWKPGGNTIGDLIEGMKLPKKIRVAYVTDFKKPVKDYSFKVQNPDDLWQELFDGMTFVNPAMRVAQRASFGGDYGTSITPVMKNLTTDISKGIKTMIKNADSSITPELLTVGTDKLRDRYRKMLSVQMPPNTLGINNAWELLGKMGVDTVNFKDFTMEQVEAHYQELVKHGLQDYMIMEIIPDTSAKTGLPRLNNIDDVSYQDDFLDITNRYNLLDASKDPSKGLFTTILSQYINAIGINYQEAPVITRIMNALALVADNFTSSLMKMGVDDTKNYMKGILRRSIEGREDFTYQTLAIQSGNFSLQDRQIFNKAVSALNSEISSNAISIKFQGGQFIVHPQSEMFEVYELPDGTIRLRNQEGWEGGKPRDLKWEDPQALSGVFAGKTLTQIYDEIYKSDSTQWSEMKAALHTSLSTDEWTQGFAEIVAPADMAKDFFLDEAIKNNLPIDMINLDYFKKVAPQGMSPETLFRGFQKRLEGIHVRIPTTGKHSAIRTRIVGFINSSMNSAFVPKEYLFVQGADQDIDKGNYLTVQSFKGRTPMVDENLNFSIGDEAYYKALPTNEAETFRTIAIKNRIATDLMHLTGHARNLVERNTPVKIVMAPWKRIIKEKGLDKAGAGKAQLSKDDYMSYAKAHQINQAGKSMVGIFANGQKAYQVLYQFFKKTGLPSSLAGLEGINEVWFRYSGLINAATDNAKEQILGMLGINMSNGYLVNYLVAAGYNENQIYDFMTKPENAASLKQKEFTERYDSHDSFTDDLWLEGNPELYFIHRKAEEFNLLSRTILNRGIPNSPEDMYKFRSSIEKFVNKSMDAGNTPVGAQGFNFVKFLNDDTYAEAWVEAYQKLLNTDSHTFNLLQVYRQVPQLRSYLRAFGHSYQTLQKQSSLFQATEQILDVIKDNREMIQDKDSDFYAEFEELNGEEKSDSIEIKKIKFRDVQDFVYGLSVDAYLKSRGGIFEDIEEDLSIPAERKKFVQKFNDSLPALQKEYENNAFVEMLIRTSRGKKEYPILRMIDVMQLNQESMLEVRHAFTKLPLALQQKFFLYSLITSKDKPGKGALNQIFEPHLKNAYLQFLDGLSPVALLGDGSEKANKKLLETLQVYAADPLNTAINFESIVKKNVPQVVSLDANPAPIKINTPSANVPMEMTDNKPKVKDDDFKVHESDLKLIAKAIEVYTRLTGLNWITEVGGPDFVAGELGKVKDLSYMHVMEVGTHTQRLNKMIEDVLKDNISNSQLTPQERVRLGNIMIDIDSRKRKLSEKEVQEKAKACGIVNLLPF